MQLVSEVVQLIVKEMLVKQVLQSLKTGHTDIADIPCPQLAPGHVLIQSTRSLISPGTEKMLVSFGQASIFNKMRQQPDKVRMVMEKIKTDGLLPTIDAVRDKLDQLIPMGYCNVGTVVAVGADVDNFKCGDRVVSNGPHAEMVCVPKHLCCKIPPDVTDDEAAFSILGAIALQGIRLAEPTLGECFVVIGLGVIGLLTVQLLHAYGCRVLAIDFDTARLAMAEKLGALTVNAKDSDACLIMADEFSRQRGVDGVMITAATTSNEPVHQAAQMSRKRGRIILVGVSGLNLIRDDFYHKELRFQVSCSYGPGRYDASYEQGGQDYPVAFVRWTENRNFEAFLDLLSYKKVTTSVFITHRFPVKDAALAYALLADQQDVLGVMLDYVQDHDDVACAVKKTQTLSLVTTNAKANVDVRIGMIGAGNYASRVLVPAFKRAGTQLIQIGCKNGVSGLQQAKRHGFAVVSTDMVQLIEDPAVNTVVIASRHDTHAKFICAALRAGKHVFVEKPLCLTLNELESIVACKREHAKQHLMIGFNRRFAPHIQSIKSLLTAVTAPKSFIMTINAGDIPTEHWIQQQAVGGGRIIGEVCHFVDLLLYLSGASISHYELIALGEMNDTQDVVSINLRFSDGSFGVIHYLANGHRSFPKERLEVFAAGKVLQLDNFRQLTGYGWPGFKKMKLWRQDKGQQQCVNQFVQAILQGGDTPIAFNDIVTVSKVCIDLAAQCDQHA